MSETGPHDLLTLQRERDMLVPQSINTYILMMARAFLVDRLGLSSACLVLPQEEEGRTMLACD